MKKQLSVLVAITALAGGTALLNAPQAEAATTIESRALSIVESKHGDPYVYGAAGPSRFDCSGLTYYAFKHAGKSIPRTAEDQWKSRSIHHVYAKNRKAGDLVFFHYASGYVYHVGVYAGGGYVWHAPHSGSYVRKERIWTSMVWYGQP